MAEIKPCPFCGSIATIHGEGSGYHVRCNNQRGCYAIGPWVNDRDSSKAIAAWNQRPEPVGEPVGYTSQPEIDKQFGVFLGAPYESICVPLYTRPAPESREAMERDHRAMEKLRADTFEGFRWIYNTDLIQDHPDGFGESSQRHLYADPAAAILAGDQKGGE